jgi:glycosyltransferase involved in cell wall biosynthesis
MAFQPEGIYLGQCRLWTEPPLLRYLPKELPKVIYCAEPKRSFHEARFIEERKKWPFWKKLWRLPTIEWMKAEMHETIMNANLVLCNSEYSKSYISKAYPGLEPNFTAIGVDCQLFKPLDLTERKRQLLSVGALDPSKNHDMAIKVAAELPKDTAFKVVIITDRAYGDTAEQLKNLAHDLQVDLEIKERIPQNELIQSYAESFATIYCPHLEPFGRVSIESQACGTPVLGKNEAGLKETIVSGISGEKFDKNPKDYAQKILEWLENPLLHQNYQKGARENVLNHWNQEKTLKNHIFKLEDFFKNHS